MENKLTLTAVSQGAALTCRAFLAGLWFPVALLIAAFMVAFSYVLSAKYWLNGELSTYNAHWGVEYAGDFLVSIYDWVFDERV